MPPDKGLAFTAKSGIKSDKQRLTYVFTTNADGSEKLQPLIIGKEKRPACFEHKSGEDLGFHYQNNLKAWMNTEIFNDWISLWDRDLKVKNTKILLLVDNFSGHNLHPDRTLSNIRLEFFAPNLTSHVQPLDAGIIASFKCWYRSEFINYAVDRYNNQISMVEIYKINQLQAMKLAAEAWYSVSKTTISNC